MSSYSRFIETERSLVKYRLGHRRAQALHFLLVVCLSIANHRATNKLLIVCRLMDRLFQSWIYYVSLIDSKLTIHAIYTLKDFPNEIKTKFGTIDKNETKHGV